MGVLLTEAQKGSGDKKLTEWGWIGCYVFFQEGWSTTFIVWTWPFYASREAKSLLSRAFPDI